MIHIYIHIYYIIKYLLINLKFDLTFCLILNLFKRTKSTLVAQICIYSVGIHDIWRCEPFNYSSKF